jgi:hypothetical protein
MIHLVSTVRAPLADLERFVAYHRHIGVDRLYLFFDDPDDPALPVFADRPGVAAIPCPPSRWQAAGVRLDQGIEARQAYNADEALSKARAAGADWLLHIDSDELIFAPGDNLAAWLAGRSPETDVVVFPVLEAIARPPRHGHPFEACRLFKTPSRPDPARLKWAARLGCRAALRYGYFRGHLRGKSAVRVGAEVQTIGIHAPTPAAAPLQVETAKGACLLHYDSCTFEAWRLKWGRRKDGTGLLLTMRPDRRRQFEDFLRADAAGDVGALEQEFRRQCLIPVYEQAVLWALSLARWVRLRRGLFRAL